MEYSKNKATKDDWINFNRAFRRLWTRKKVDNGEKNHSAIQLAASLLYELVSSPEGRSETSTTSEDYDLPDMIEQIIKCIEIGLDRIYPDWKI